MSKNPTPLPVVNYILDHAGKVADEGADPTPLCEFVQIKIEEVVRGREEFEQGLAEKDEEFELDHQDIVGDTFDGFDAYEGALRLVLSSLETENFETLAQAREDLLELAGPFHEAVQAYGRAALGWGPSDYDEMNAVCTLLKAIAEGKAPAEVLENFVTITCNGCDVAIAEIDANEELNEHEGFQAKKKAYQDIKLALSELTPVVDEEAIPEMIHALQLALEAKTFAEQKIFTTEATLKPTNLPAANVLVAAIQGALDENWEINVVDEALEWYKDYIEDIVDKFDEALEGEDASPAIAEELPRTREIFDLHEELIERLEEAFQDEFSAETIDPLIEEFIEIVERLEESTDVYLKAAEREGQLVCVKCGHSNPPVNRSCESCGVRLPKLIDPSQYTATFEVEERAGLDVETDAEDDYHMGVNTYRLFEACYAFFEKQITAEEFKAEIEKSRNTLKVSERGLAELNEMKELNEKQVGMMTPDELEAHNENLEMVQETRELLEDGIEEWGDGLDSLEEFIQNRRRHTLEAGIQAIFVASQKIHKVAKLGEVAAGMLSDLDAQIRQEWKEEEEKEREEERALYQKKKEEPAEEEPPQDGTLA